jgi:kynurenine formamidase
VFDVMPSTGGIVTKGVLVDAPRLRDVEYIERGDGVGVADIEAAEREHGVRVEKGDVLLLRTGQLGRRDITGPVDIAVGGSSGPSPDLLPLLQERQVAVIGSDTGNDVAPNPYDLFTNPVHQVGIVGLGLWILDNAWLDDLANACRERGQWEFMISILPLTSLTAGIRQIIQPGIVKNPKAQTDNSNLMNRIGKQVVRIRCYIISCVRADDCNLTFL